MAPPSSATKSGPPATGAATATGADRPVATTRVSSANAGAASASGSVATISVRPQLGNRIMSAPCGHCGPMQRT